MLMLILSYAYGNSYTWIDLPCYAFILRIHVIIYVPHTQNILYFNNTFIFLLYFNNTFSLSFRYTLTSSDTSMTDTCELTFRMKPISPLKMREKIYESDTCKYYIDVDIVAQLGDQPLYKQKAIKLLEEYLTYNARGLIRANDELGVEQVDDTDGRQVLQ